MEGPEYKAELDKLRVLNTMVLSIDLEGLSDAMERAQAVGPFVDPTLFMRGTETLRAQQRAVSAAKEYQAAVRELAAEAGVEH